MNPPLRSKSDLEAILAALADGSVDASPPTTAPHAAHEKGNGIRARGVRHHGIGNGAGACDHQVASREAHPAGAHRGTVHCRSGAVFRFFAGVGSLVRGSIADVTIFDPKKKWTFEAAKSRSKSKKHAVRWLVG